MRLLPSTLPSSTNSVSRLRKNHNMSQKAFPIFTTKVNGVSERFDLSDPEARQRYFQAKAGKEISALRDYLKKNTFVGYLIGKKNSGKGTYSKLFMDAVGRDHLRHVAIGDI